MHSDAYEENGVFFITHGHSWIVIGFHCLELRSQVPNSDAHRVPDFQYASRSCSDNRWFFVKLHPISAFLSESMPAVDGKGLHIGRCMVIIDVCAAAQSQRECPQDDVSNHRSRAPNYERHYM